MTASTIIPVVSDHGLTSLTTPALDLAVAGAAGWQAMITTVEKADPTFAERIAATTTDQSLLGSKTVWVPPLTYAVSWASTHWVLGLDQAACQTLAVGLAYAAVLYGRWTAKYQVARVLPARWTQPPAPSTMRSPPAIAPPRIAPRL